MLLLAAANLAMGVDIETAIEPDSIYLGESVMLTLRVEGFEEGMAPDLDALPDGDIEPRGHSDQHFQNITIINGRPQVNRFSGRIYQYRITPSRTGTYALGPVRIRRDTQILKEAPGPMVRVGPVPAQDRVRLTLDAPSSGVVLDQPFNVTLRLRIRRLPDPYADISPLPDQAPPLLDIPYLEMAQDSGIEAEDIPKRLQGMRVAGGDAFRINGYTDPDRDPFGGLLGRRQESRFRLEREAIPDADGHPAFEYRFPLRYIARREGEYRFGPVAFKGRVFVEVSPEGEGLTETIYAIAEPVVVSASPPPEKGRPATYIGAIGSNLTVNAALDTQTCDLGDPLTLTIEISGDVRLESITAPRLDIHPKLDRDFKIYADTARRESAPDGLRYHFTLRPVRTGTLELPPMAISYYDTIRKAYRTLYTEPIPVRANAVTEVAPDMLIGADPATGNRMTIGGADNDYASGLRPAPALPPPRGWRGVTPFWIPRLHMPLLLAAPLFWLAGPIATATRRLRHGGRRRFERQRAVERIIRRIHCPPPCAEPAETARELTMALRNYLGVHLGPATRSVTPDECKALLTASGIEPSLAAETRHLLERLEHTIFSAAAADDDPSAWTSETMALLRALDAAWPRSPHRRKAQWTRYGASAGVLVLLAWGGMTIFDSDTNGPGPRFLNPDAAFEEQRATAALLEAETPDDFAVAADALAVLIDQGAANASLFYHYGTALLMAGEPAGAWNALARAERYGGSAWEIRRNQLLARRALEGQDAVLLPWHRIPLFWHYHLAARTRLTLASVAFFLAGLAAALRRRRREPASVFLWTAIVVTLVFGASAGASFHADYQSAIDHAMRQPAVAPPDAEAEENA